MNCVRFMSSTILCIFLGIQTVSHSQYYPQHHPYRPSSDYDYYNYDQDYSASALQPSKVTTESFYEPPYRQNNHHQDFYNEPSGQETTVRYFGTMNNAVPSKSETTDKGSSEEASSHQQSDSVANYRIRYNNPPPPESQEDYYPPRNFYDYSPPPPPDRPPPRPSFQRPPPPTSPPDPPPPPRTFFERLPPPARQPEPPPPRTFFERLPPPARQPEPPPPRTFFDRPPQREILPAAPQQPPRPASRSRGISIVLDDQWQMNIHFPESEVSNPRDEVYRYNANRNQRPPLLPPPKSSVDRGRRVEGNRQNLGPEDNEDEKEPPYAIIVVIDNRPTQRCQNETYLLYRENGRCYPPGTSKSPCRNLMKFYPEDDELIYGDCDCDIGGGQVSRPIAYWKPHDRCYYLYQRGPCRYSEWLILDRDGYPHCASRSCPQGSDESEPSQEFWFRYKGKCYKTGEYYATFCTVGQEGWKVYFKFGSNKPECMRRPPLPPNASRDFLSPVTDLRCKPGYKKMQNGHCKRVARFDDYDY